MNHTCAPLSASIQHRQLLLVDEAGLRLALPLDQGGRHRVIVPDPATANALVAALECCPDVGVLPNGGGLLGAMTVAENFNLALHYDCLPPNDRNWEPELVAALVLCGVGPKRIATLGREQPMNLDRRERWILGFARWLVRPPELLVIDRPCAGLPRRQANEVIAVEAVYHQRHPFRPVIFVDLDSHDLPDLPNCKTLTELVEDSCHS